MSILLGTADDHVRRRVGALADASGLPVVTDVSAGVEPDVAVVDLDRDDGLDVVRRWRAAWPDALLVGYLSVPDRERWVAAQREGCDVVCNRGALVVKLRERLADLAGGRHRRFPLFEAADVAGRLGLVARIDGTPVGPVAVYQVGGTLHALSDVCPHAGAQLSHGELDGAVLTCPGHGSRFDVRTGERLRGPADVDAAVHRVVVEEGQVSLVLEQA